MLYIAFYRQSFKELFSSLITYFGTDLVMRFPIFNPTKILWALRMIF